jgi:hypothetical protein
MPKRHRLTTRLSKNKFKEGICIHGHFNPERGFGVSDYYPEVDQFITILRDPFEIHISNYFFIKKFGTNFLWNGSRVTSTMDQSWGIERYLANTRSFMLLHLPADLTLDNFREILEERFIYVGIVERLQESVNQLARILGFSPIEVGRLNSSPRTESIPDNARDIFINKHPLESALYEYALKHYSN